MLPGAIDTVNYLSVHPSLQGSPWVGSESQIAPSWGSDSGFGSGEGQAVQLRTHPAVLGFPSPHAGPMQLLVAAQDSERPFAQE